MVTPECPQKNYFRVFANGFGDPLRMSLQFVCRTGCVIQVAWLPQRGEPSDLELQTPTPGTCVVHRADASNGMTSYAMLPTADVTVIPGTSTMWSPPYSTTCAGGACGLSLGSVITFAPVGVL